MVRTPFVVSFRPHRVCGNTYGFWCESRTGKKFYLAMREGSGLKGVFRLSDSWCLDEKTLELCKLDGIDTIFLIHKVGRKHIKHHFYATRIEDFYGPFSSPHSGMTPMGVCRQRALPRRAWRVNPIIEKVAGMIKIR